MQPDTIEPYTLHIVEEHLHMAARAYPTLAAGVVVTGAAGAWTLGVAATIVPANTIGSTFDIHWVIVEAASLDDVYELVLYADGVEIGRIRTSVKGAVAGNSIFSDVPIMTPLIAANSAITAKIANSAGGSESLTISLGYHTY